MHGPARRRIAVALAAAVAPLLAAGGCSDPAPSIDGGDTAANCADETRDDTWVADLEKAGSEGLVTARFVDAVPAPPARFENLWTLELRDLDGAPLDDLTIAVQPFMPDHAHGTSVVPTVEGLGDGSYRIGDIDLWMPALWEVRLSIDTGAATDRVVFSFCIEE
jgi:hypothetical protein